jgi:hypothetical protein
LGSALRRTRRLARAGRQCFIEAETPSIIGCLVVRRMEALIGQRADGRLTANTSATIHSGGFSEGLCIPLKAIDNR